MSESNRTRLAYIAEQTWNTTPASPELQALRITGESFVHNIDNITSAEIRNDRNVAALIQASKYSGGGFNFELSSGSYDDLLVAALFSSGWTEQDSSGGNEEIKNGVTQTSFSVERANLDKTQFFMFPGQVVNTLNLTVSAGAIVTGSFDFMGGFPATGLQQTTFDASSNTTPKAASTTDPFNGIGNVGTIKEGGVALSGIYLSEISFSLSNNLRSLPALGQDTPIQISAGKCDITGTVTAYFEDESLYDKFIGGTETSMEFTLTDADSNTIRFNFPLVKYESDTANATGQDTDIMETLGFRAIYDTSEAAQIVIERSSALSY